MRAVAAVLILSAALAASGAASALPPGGLPAAPLASPASQTVDPCYRRCRMDKVWSEKRKMSCFFTCKRARKGR